MALHGEIRVNGGVIGEWEAVRQTITDAHPHSDDVLIYGCAVRQDSTLEGNPAVLERFVVEHRFGDGALALAAKVLSEADRRAKLRI